MTAHVESGVAPVGARVMASVALRSSVTMSRVHQLFRTTSTCVNRCLSDLSWLLHSATIETLVEDLALMAEISGVRLISLR